MRRLRFLSAVLRTKKGTQMESVTRGPTLVTGTVRPDVSITQSILEALNGIRPQPAAPAPQRGAQPFTACSGPDERTPPSFEVVFRRPVPFNPVQLPSGPGVDSVYAWRADNKPCVLAGAKVKLPPGADPGFCQIDLGVDLRILQTWNLQGLSIGDLASTMALAPSEQLTLEFQTSLRRTLDQTKEDSAEEMTSTDSSTLDKEVMNVSRMSSNTQHWYVDGEASYSQGSKGLSASVKAGYSQTIVDESRSTIDHTSETTRKSAHTLKTMHKVIVRGTTETFVQNRMTRVIKNPYVDRTLAINVFQLVKHFSVETKLDDLRPVLLIEVDGLGFDADFVQAHQDFLRTTLLDSTLVEELPTAVTGAQLSTTFDEATAAAKDALSYLFGQHNVFQLPPQVGSWTAPAPIPDPNDPANSLNANLRKDGSINTTALKESLDHHYSQMLVLVNFFYRVYLDYQAAPDNKLDRYAVFLAKAILDNATDIWINLVKDPKNQSDVEALYDNQNYTEIFRRLPGFLAMVSGVVAPLVGEAPTTSTAGGSGANTPDPFKQRQDAIHAFQRLTTHLESYQHYYAQQFLSYVAGNTKNQAIVDFVNQLLDTLLPSTVPSLIRSFFDVERSFIDRQYITTPALITLTEANVTQLSLILSPGGANNQFSLADIPSAVDTIEVPCDGIHLEVAAGSCVLESLPPLQTSVELNVQGASLKASGA